MENKLSRCPNGSRRNKKTLKCDKINKSIQQNKTTKNKIQSFSPIINKKLKLHNFKTMDLKTITFCDDILKIQINEVCKNYTNSNVIKLFLNNLKSKKTIEVDKIIPPKQLHSNCWFNTMFMVFFISDKGRKFFKYFRELMIRGKKLDNTPIPKNIAKLFFILNIFIEASLNQYTKNNYLYTYLNNYTTNLNTNYFIIKIYEIIKEYQNKMVKNKTKKNIDNLINNTIENIKVPNIKDPGNPIKYYESILKFLSYDTLNIFKLNILDKKNIVSFVNYFFKNKNTIPDIILLEDFESKTQHNKTLILENNKVKYNYILDSIIITNKDHYDPKKPSHFVCLLTINKEQYKFDGSSIIRMEKFNWLNMINKNEDWSFKDNPKYYPVKYNFTKGYKIMFYYRI